MSDRQGYHVEWFVGRDARRDVTIQIRPGEGLSIEPGRAANAIELGPVALVDGLVNAHTHLEFSSFSSPIPTTGRFTDWIRAVVAHRRANPSSVSESIRSGVRESVTAGTTLIGDIATAGWNDSDYQGTGFQGVVFQETLGLLPERITQQKELARGHAARQPPSGPTSPAARTPTIVHGISPHAPYSTHRELLQDAVALSQRTGCPLAMHLAETRSELELLTTEQGEFRELLSGWGLWQDVPGRFCPRPLDYLRILAEAPRGLVIHGNYLDDEELRFLATQPQMSLIYCPRTHAAFGHAPHPWRKALDLGIRVALGTDSRASNPDLSLFAELQFLAASNPDLSHLDLLKLGSVAGRVALGFPGIGHADFTLIRLANPQGPLERELLSPTSRVCGTMMRGEWRWFEPPQP